MPLNLAQKEVLATLYDQLILTQDESNTIKLKLSAEESVVIAFVKGKWQVVVNCADMAQNIKQSNEEALKDCELKDGKITFPLRKLIEINGKSAEDICQIILSNENDIRAKFNLVSRAAKHAADDE